MALDFAGISNLEFYSAHYLDAVLEGDLKPVFDRWKKEHEEEGRRLPHEVLAGLANRYFVSCGRAEGKSDQRVRLEAAQDFHAHLVEALGYTRAPGLELLDNSDTCPVVFSLRRDGQPFLWIVETVFPEKDDDDPLSSQLLAEQAPADRDVSLPKGETGETATWRELLDNRIFRLERPPRWVIFLAGREALLIDRHKWAQGRYLRFSFGELFGRRQAAAMRAVAGLLHKDVLAPDSGVSLHDALEESSHKHAFAVSSDLKHGVRRAVELLANEAVYYRSEVQHLALYQDEMAGKLTAESLTWLYRLLFLFYVESRGGELGVVPMQSDTYRWGYSLETLRDLELVPLTSEHARNGTYIHESLGRLFQILNAGFPTIDPEARALPFGDQHHNTMLVDALNSPLFDDNRLEVLKNVKFRNFVLQEVLQLLSLSGEKKGKKRGRISYAQLGINQLGAVYEGLLSYTGFFASEDLYEVAAEKDCEQLSGKPAAEREALRTYFVPTGRIGDYKEGEIVKDEKDRKVVHKKGTFIFRLAGRNREKSASYYTPEVLTRCVVKYALKELLWEEGEEGEKPRRKKTADEILALTICEPAMGSSAFLIEAIDQLADAYLEARQEERGEAILSEDYQREKRRVKARLATNNCYGVDLNPTAVELAKVSLWLATLHEGGKCPWFGLRLATGNSLVGARREVFKTADVTRKGTKKNPNWLGLVPEPVSLYRGSLGPPADEQWTAPPRPKGTIYHFLLPAEGMAAFDNDKVIKQLAPESVKQIKEWRREFCKPFNKTDAKRLEQISDAVDRLFAQVVRERVLATQETSDRIPVWGESRISPLADLLVRDQEEVAASLEDGSSAYRRLKLAMDAWCALWFWPISETGLLPDRATWLAQMELILRGQVSSEPISEQGSLFAELVSASESESGTSHTALGDRTSPDLDRAERLKRLQKLSDSFRERRSEYFEECGLADVDSLFASDVGLRVAQNVAERLLFHHWSLRFAEVFAHRGGFDLLLGNPPWVKLAFDAGAVISDVHPRLVLDGLTSTQIESRISDEIADHNFAHTFLDEFEQLTGLRTFLGARSNYRRLAGQQPNVYKSFLLVSLTLAASPGAVGLIHPQGIFNHAKAGGTREYLYPRLRYFFHFHNQWPLFSEVLHTRQFAVCIYRSVGQGEIDALQISSLVHPSTIDACLDHDGLGKTQPIKTDNGAWNIAGHRNRVVRLDGKSLRLIARALGEDAREYLQTRMPLIYSSDLLSSFIRFASDRVPLRDDSCEFAPSDMWHEKGAQDRGIIQRHVANPQHSWQLILSGPHIYVANPLYQTANVGCSSPLDYSDIDLLSVAENFLPRAVYRPLLTEAEYTLEIPTWRNTPITERYRVVARRRIDPYAERTLAAAIIPPKVGHIGGCFGMAMDEKDIIRLAWAYCSLPFDFFVRSVGKSDFQKETAEILPMLQFGPLQDCASIRILRLVCLTQAYSALWSRHSMSVLSHAVPCGSDPRFDTGAGLASDWNYQSALRSPLSRRQALVEIDCLAAMSLGMTVDELAAVYRLEFATLNKNESRNLFDQMGRVLPTARTANGSQGVSLVELAATLKEQAGFDVHAEYHPDGSNTQELRKQKIRLGKKEAEVLGVSERCTMTDLLAETGVRWSDEKHPEGRPVRLIGLRYTDPGLEPRMERIYPTPWTRCDREADYRQAWTEFERRLGKKMPEGTPL